MLGVFLIAALALFSRLPFFAFSSYPLNDGGMFAQIIDDLRANNWLLPRETAYNVEHIPLCYPPLGFYFGAIAGAVTHQSAMQVLRWLPLLVNLASLPVVYLIALEFFAPPVIAFAATAVYAVIPRSALWLVMGGGLTRSPGEVFALIAILLFLRARRLASVRMAAAAGVFTGLSILTHLEAATFAVVSLLLLAWESPPRLKRSRLLVVAGTVSAAVITPWVLFCLVRFGTGPFAAAFLTRGHDGSAGPGVKLFEIVPWLALAALMYLLRQPPFALWILALMVLVARSSDTHIVVPESLLAAWFISMGTERYASERHPARQIAFAGAALYLVLGCLWTAAYLHRHLLPHDRLEDLIQNERATLSPEETAAMQWVDEHTHSGARFLVYDQRTDIWASDFVGEWFPYLAKRHSTMTAQGREWLPGGAFGKTLESLPKFNMVFTPGDIAAKINGRPFDYIFLSGPFHHDHEHIRQALEHWPGFTNPVYHSANVEILARSEP